MNDDKKKLSEEASSSSDLGDTDSTPEAASDILKKAGERIEKLAGLGMNVGSLKEKHQNAEKAYKAKKYPDVIHACEEILVLANVALQEVESSLGKHIHGDIGELKKGTQIDPRYIQRVIDKVIKEEVEKVVHSRALRQMVEMIAIEEAEEIVKEQGILKAEFEEKAVQIANSAVAADKEEHPQISEEQIGKMISEAISTALKEYSTSKDVNDVVSEKARAIAEEEIGKIEKVTSEDVQKEVADAVSGLLTGDELQSKITELAEEKARSISKEVADSALESADILSQEDISGIISGKLEGFERITEDDVRTIAKEVVSGIETVTMEQVTSAIEEKVSSLPQLTKEDVKSIAEEAVSGTETFTAAEAEKLIEEKLSGAEQLTEEDVRRIAGEAASGMDTLSPEKVASIVSEKLGGLPQVTEEDVRRIVNEVVSGQKTVTPDEVGDIVSETISSMNLVDEDKAKELVQAGVPDQKEGSDVETVRGEIKNAVASLLESEVFKDAVNKQLDIDEKLNAMLDTKIESMQRVLTASQPSRQPPPPPPPGPSKAEIEKLIDARMEKIKAQAGASGSGGGGMSPEELKESVKKMLPDLISGDDVQSVIISTIAMQAVSAPGALGDLTGLKTFLQEQIQESIKEMM